MRRWLICLKEWFTILLSQLGIWSCRAAIVWTNLYGVRWQFHVGPAHLKGRCHQDQPRTGHVQAMQKAAVVPSIGEDGLPPQHVLRWLCVKTSAP